MLCDVACFSHVKQTYQTIDIVYSRILTEFITIHFVMAVNDSKMLIAGDGFGVPHSPGSGLESESAIRRRLQLQALSVSSGLLCNFLAVYLTFVQFILQLKLCTLFVRK